MLEIAVLLCALLCVSSCVSRGLGMKSEMRCLRRPLLQIFDYETLILLLLLLLPSPQKVHARNLCAQGDPDYDHTCAGAVFLSGGMSCGYVPDVHEVWVCVDPRLTMGECGPARHQLADWQRARPQHQACFTFHESTHQFEYLGDNLSLNLTGGV